MKAVLGFDTATATLAVAAGRDGETLRETIEGPDPRGRPRHSELLLPAVEACVEAAGGWGEIGRIAVGVGPGSFTGLRIGISTARALAQARELPLVPVGTLAALGRGIGAHPAGKGRSALPVIDARRGQAFAALYGASGEEVRAPSVLGPEGLRNLARGADSAPLAAGDGALRFAEELAGAGATVAPSDDSLHLVSARLICAFGEEGLEPPPGEVEPVYLREPDAKRWIERDARDRGD